MRLKLELDEVLISFDNDYQSMEMVITLKIKYELIFYHLNNFTALNYFVISSKSQVNILSFEDGFSNNLHAVNT